MRIAAQISGCRWQKGNGQYQKCNVAAQCMAQVPELRVFADSPIGS
jgi:hypothetical protein